MNIATSNIHQDWQHTAADSAEMGSQAPWCQTLPSYYMKTKAIFTEDNENFSQALTSIDGHLKAKSDLNFFFICLEENRMAEQNERCHSPSCYSANKPQHDDNVVDD